MKDAASDSDRPAIRAAAKRTIMQYGTGGWTVNPTATREAMIGWTREGKGAGWQGEKIFEIDVLDAFRDTASVRCLSPEYVDHFHLARIGAEGWKIVNVLWQFREGDDRPGD